MPTRSPFDAATIELGAVTHTSDVNFSLSESLHGHHVRAPSGSDSVQTMLPPPP